MSTENMNDTAVDFSNPEAIDEALAAAAEQELGGAGATAKAAKHKKPRIIKVSWVADRDIAAGDTVEFDYELPAKAGTRGQLTGIPLEDMTDDQLKIEYRNAHSVFYKTQKAGRDTTKASERLERVKAEMAKRGIQPTSRASTMPVTAATVANLIKSGKINVDELQKLLDAGEDATETVETAE